MTELTISISELRIHFDEYINRVKSGNVIVVTKYRKPIAQFTPAKMLEEKEKSTSSKKRKEDVDVQKG